MSDIDHLLRRDAEQWNARRLSDDIDLDADLGAALCVALHRPRAASRPRLLAVAAAVLVTITLAVTMTLIERGRPSAPPADTNAGPLVSTQLGNLVVRHPASWRYIPVQMKPLGIATPLGWLVNERAHKQCVVTVRGRSTTCKSPVTRLVPGGVYLAATAVDPVAPPLQTSTSGATFAFQPNTTVDGHAAELTDNSGPLTCPAGTTDHLTLVIAASRNPNPEHNGYITLVACTSHPTTPVAAAVRLALTTTRVNQ